MKKVKEVAKTVVNKIKEVAKQALEVVDKYVLTHFKTKDNFKGFIKDIKERIKDFTEKIKDLILRRKQKTEATT